MSLAAEICQLAHDGKLEDLKLKLQGRSELIYSKDTSGRLPIHWACSGGRANVVQFMLDCDGQRLTDTQDELQWTPLMIATSAGWKDVVMLLIGRGADVNALNSTGQCSLHYAASKDRFEIAEVLLQNGANASVGDNYGHTPLHRASCKGYVRIIKLLLQHQADASRRDSEGNTALHAACEENELETAKLLLDFGACWDTANKAGNTPLDLAPLPLRKQLQKYIELR